MNKHKILIYDFHELFIILDEIKELLNLEVEELLNIKDLKSINFDSQKNLIVSKVKISEDFNSLSFKLILIFLFELRLTSVFFLSDTEYVVITFSPSFTKISNDGLSKSTLEKGDETPITWLHQSERFYEKLATPRNFNI